MHFLRVSAILIFMQAFINFVASVTCPPAYEVHPCTCIEIPSYGTGTYSILTCSDAGTGKEQIKKALHSLKDHEHLQVELNDIKLGTITFDFFNGVKVKHLYINNSQITSFSGGGGLPFQGLENSLEVLSIQDSITIEKGSKGLPFGHLRNLIHLQLNGNEIFEFNNDWLKNASKSLESVLVNDNDIEFIGDRAFADVTNVEALHLTGNRFGPITRSMFPNPAPMLNELYLNNNALTNLPENLFTNMPKLKIIYLLSNGLTYLPENTWRNVWNTLNYVDLSGNPLVCDSRMDWMSQTLTCAKILGECAHPRKKRGQPIPAVYDKNCHDKPKDDIEELKNCVDVCFEKHQNKYFLLHSQLFL